MTGEISFWDKWLTVAADLPADSPSWNSLGLFVTALRDLAALKRAEAEANAPLVWRDWLQHASTVEPASEVWEGLGAFLNGLEMFAEAKAEERVSQRAALQRLLDHLNSYPLDDYSPWNVASFGGNEGEAARIVKALSPELDDYLAASKTLETVGASHLTVHSNMKRLVVQFDGILARLDELRMLAAASAPPGAYPEPAAPIPPAVPDEGAQTTAPVVLNASSIPVTLHAVAAAGAETPPPAAQSASASSVAPEIPERPEDVVPEVFADSGPIPDDIRDVEESQPVSPPAAESAELESVPITEAPKISGPDPAVQAEVPQHWHQPVYAHTAGRCGLPQLANLAEALDYDSSLETQNGLVCGLMAADDLSGAYWLSRSISACGGTPVFPDWLLAAVQGGLWIEQNFEPIAYDLQEFCTDPNADQANAYLKLAAAFNAALLSPESGMLAWLADPSQCTGMTPLVEAVRDFANPMVPLDTRLLRTPVPVPKASFENIISRADKWLKHRNSYNFTWVGCRNAWRHLVATDGELTRMCEIVANDARAQAEDCKSLIRFWMRRRDAINRINVLSNLQENRPVPIQGHNLERILERVHEPVAIAQEWCALIESERGIVEDRREERLRIEELKTRAEEALNIARTALSLLRVPDCSVAEATAVHVLERSLERLEYLLGLSSESSEPLWQDAVYLGPAPGLSLDQALERRLWWMPQLGDGTRERNLSAESAGEIIQGFSWSCREGRSLEAALDIWLDRGDYRFSDLIAAALGPAARAKVLNTRNAELKRLEERKSSLRNAVEQAVLDGIVLDRRAEFHGSVEAIVPAKTLQFAKAQQRLDEVEQSLAEEKRSRLAHFEERWNQLKSQLCQESLNPGQAEAVITFIEGMRGQPRTFSECLADLAEAMDTEGDLAEKLASLSWAAVPEPVDVLREFLAFSADVEKQIASNPHLIGEMRDGLNAAQSDPLLHRVPADRSGEVQRALAAWQNLKDRCTEPARTAAICELLKFLNVSAKESECQTELDSHEAFGISASLSTGLGARPLWMFGSGAAGFRILVVWDRPSAVQLDALCREQRQDWCTIVLYLGARGAEQRNAFGARCRQHPGAVIVMDENLLLYLTGATDNRYPVLLSCAAPYSGVNPYTPDLQGYVHPEMFYGREAAVAEVANSYGPCILYGGRQLGKTVIQQQVASRYHRPALHQYAWVIRGGYYDKSIGETAKVWRALRDKFREDGIFSSQQGVDSDSEVVSSQIKSVFAKDPLLRVVVMFDEADDFLDIESRQEFPNVKVIRDLMNETGHRFKAVFAGNRKVDRFAAISDQPLAQFGRPILIGPMEPRVAQEMVREPMAALGYKLSARSILAVLTYTNYHPVLIHAVCAELLQRKRKQVLADTFDPPVEIAPDEITAVYGTEAVRDKIRQMHEWTVRLEEDYQVVALALIADQLAAHDSFSRAYSFDEVLYHAKTWWPEGFDDRNSETLQMRLEEMCDMGLLVRDKEGKYRLRSPNVVGLLSDRDIAIRLKDWNGKARVKSWAPDSHHRKMEGESDGGIFSPFTRTQESSLFRQESGVALAFVSEALGEEHLPAVFRHLESAHEGGVLAEIAGPVSAVELVTNLEKLWGRQKRHAVVHIRCGEHSDTEALVESALEFCTSRRSDLRSVRAVFSFDAQACCRWLCSPTSGGLEQRARCVVAARPWDHDGVLQWLSSCGVTNDALAKSVLKATGGWPILLRTLVNSDPSGFSRVISDIERSLKAPGDPFREGFIRALGVPPDSIAHSVLRVLCQQPDEYPRADLLEFLNLERVVTAVECDDALKMLDRLGCIQVTSTELRVNSALALAVI